MAEGPYELPQSWRWVRLGEIVRNVQPGFAFGKKKTVNGDLLHIRPFNIGVDGGLDLAQRVYILSSGVEKGLTQLEPGDVLFNNTNSVELVGKTAVIREPLKAAWSNHVTRLRTDTSKCEPGWLAFSLRVLWLQGFFARNCNKWIGQAGFNTDALKVTEIPLPPLSEQRRIVARIEELMERIREARRLREEARQDTERLWQSVLAETFPHPGSELPKGWRWVTLGEVVTFERRSKKATELPQRLPYVGMEHIESGSGIVDIGKCPPVSSIRSHVYLYNQSHVLYGKLRPYLNKVYLPKEEGACTTELLPLRPNPFHAGRHFLAWYLRSPAFVSYANAHTTGARQPRVDPRALVAALIPLPPLSEQRRIVAYLEAVQARIRDLKEEQAATQAELKRLEQAILEKAFRGEL